MESLEHAIRDLLNNFSAENGSDTPDFLLADFLLACLDTFNKTVKARDTWYGVHLEPGNKFFIDSTDATRRTYITEVTDKNNA